QARKLCRPTGVAVCSDALGGFCDRVTLPQPCSRSNSAGMCAGQRACLAASQRYDRCGAAAPQCKPDCSMQDPAGCTGSSRASAASTPNNCGPCGLVCPGYQSTASNVTCQGGSTCTFSCQGESYNVSGDAAQGCSVADAPTGNHTQQMAVSDGSFSCVDG